MKKSTCARLIIRDEEGKVLVMRRKVVQGDKTIHVMQIPGGGVDEGEYVRDGLVREVMEETGLKLWPCSDEIEILGETEHEAFEALIPEKGRAAQTSWFVYNYPVSSWEVKIQEPDKFDLLTWIPVKELIAMVKLCKDGHMKGILECTRGMEYLQSDDGVHFNQWSGVAGNPEREAMIAHARSCFGY